MANMILTGDFQFSGQKLPTDEDDAGEQGDDDADRVIS